VATSSTGITQLEAALDHLYGARYALGLAKTEAYTVLEPRIAAECERWLGVLLAMTYGLAEAMAQLPCILYERLPRDAGKERSDDPLAWVLHNEPNPDQSWFEFGFQMQAWAANRRFAYAEIRWDGGRVGELTPRHPDRIRIEKLDSGKTRYGFLEDDNRTWRPILRDEMFRVPGKPTLEYARESFGMAMSIQRYAGSTFANGVRPSGLISHDPKVEYTETARTNLKNAIKAEHAGPDKAGGILMLPEGLNWTALGMTNQQAEVVALTTATIEDVARWYNYPPYRLAVLKEGTVSYASIEMQGIDFVVYTLMPWVRRWEGAIHRDLILDKRGQFAEFLMAALLRGTTKERYDAYAVAIQWGWMSVNDVRRLENLNPIAGGDLYLRPLNMTPSKALRQVGGGETEAGRLLRTLVDDAAGRIVRKEVAAMLRASEKHADNPQAWEQAVRTFYDSHGDHVAATIHLPKGEALAYARSQRDELLTEGPAAIEHWQNDGKVDDLVELALETA